jgi:hypothetical protein
MIFNPVAFVLSLIFCPLAALCAFLITFDEYSHHYPNKRKPFQLALEAAIYTFIFFLFISLLIGFFISKFI